MTQVEKVRILPPNYTQGVDNLSPQDFLKIYLETLRFQDPFQQQDLSKMLDDMVKLNQVKFFNDVRNTLENLKDLTLQMTLAAGLSVLNREVYVSSEDIIPNGATYYLMSDRDIKGAVVQFTNDRGDVKTIRMDIEKGVNVLSTEALSEGTWKVNVLYGGEQVQGVSLLVKDKVRSVELMGGQVMLELYKGGNVPITKLVRVEG
ncbi:flagellar hook capping protein [Thermocrinis albus DSM 14484]|uniref:Flagellar hook capping protein n=1 Tax=Thermocrinis albus (strain DSM 14484 / JCM 11386 / HI 11/12) TaxID=638303 RepID=D3SP97_THEAH|nr:flagellar hook capping FlgD N-terminal domain-containing protein [Thermocrinis albus]ADC88984.1 flagellar hook capping protein [Thermocrinis albus DSM 14484]